MVALLATCGANIDRPFIPAGHATILDVLDMSLRCNFIIEDGIARAKQSIQALVDHGARVLPTHSTWIRARHAARQDALRRRAYAAACMLVPGFRREHGLPPDMARLLARIVWRADWREWLEGVSE